jgi:hypothetical protein
VNAEFNWWLLIVGLVVGAGLVWLVLADSRRRESEIDEHEMAGEALWLAAAMTEEGYPMSAETAERLLRLHHTYLAALPPDDPDPESESELAEAPGAGGAEVAWDAERERDRDRDPREPTRSARVGHVEDAS